MLTFLLPLALSFAVALCATGLLAFLAPRWAWVDAPNLVRKKQARPVPPVGGAAVLLGACAAALVFGFEAPFGLSAKAAGASLFAGFLVGLLDDVRPGGLRPRSKLALQAGASLPLAWNAAVVFGADSLSGPLSGALAFAVVILAALLAMNLANTFDHADGALGGVGAVGLLLAGAPVAGGAVLGFLPWNLNAGSNRKSTPSAYLGDAGSHLIGWLLLLHPFAWPALLLPALDLLRLSIERIRVGSRPWIGDRRHVAHRMEALGLGSRPVALCLAVAGVPAFFGGLSGEWSVAPGLLGMALSGVLYLWMHIRSRAFAGEPIQPTA